MRNARLLAQEAQRIFIGAATGAARHVDRVAILMYAVCLTVGLAGGYFRSLFLLGPTTWLKFRAPDELDPG